MKNLLALFALALLFIQTATAQSPQAIPFQAVARDTNGVLISNQNISLRLSVRYTTATGTIGYRETQFATTNNLGLLTLSIGTGTPITGTLNGINWGNGPIFIQVEADPTGGTNYINLGTSQLQSVPYALYSLNSGNVPQPTGQIPYGTGTGITSDALFTRNTTTHNTQMFRTASGINEGFSIGPAVGGYIPDGTFITRIDTPENHYDFIGMGNFSVVKPGVNNGVGIICVSNLAGSGPTATILIADSNPVNTTINISCTNNLTTTYKAKGTISPTGISWGVTSNGSRGPSGGTVNIDTTTVHFTIGSFTYNWPTVPPVSLPSSDTTTLAQSESFLASDANGNLNWINFPSISSGATGSTGAQGGTGPTGANGATGVSGVTGATGADGAMGVAGVTGANGSVGSAGPTGARGGTGANGTNGSNGATGATGATGTNGSNGAVGATGITGSTGAMGVAGATGSVGSVGPTGAQGGTGANGTNGSNGATGATGATGTNGSNGAVGATGITGSTGATGSLSSGSTAGNTPYWNGSSWVLNSSNIYNNGGNIGLGTSTPNSTLQDSGSVSYKLTIHTASYTVSSTDHFVICTTNSFTVTLPTAVGITGREYIIKEGTAGKTITIATTSSQTIDGSAPGSISGIGVLRVVSNGTNWYTW